MATDTNLLQEAVNLHALADMASATNPKGGLLGSAPHEVLVDLLEGPLVLLLALCWALKLQDCVLDEAFGSFPRL